MEQQQVVQTKLIEEQSDDESDQFSTIKRSPRDAEKKAEFNNQINEPQEDFKNTINNQETASYNNFNSTSQHMQHITEQQFVDEVIYQDLSEGPGLQARALYDYQAGMHF